MFEEYDDLLTVDEACEILKIGHNTIYTLLNSNKLKGFRCGRIWKMPKISVEQFILENAGIFWIAIQPIESELFQKCHKSI